MTLEILAGSDSPRNQVSVSTANYPGTMATLGPGAAVVAFPSGRTLTGRPAWLAWLGLHVAELIGFRNRASVLMDWLVNYGTRDRAATLIVRGPGAPRHTPGEDVDADAA